MFQDLIWQTLFADIVLILWECSGLWSRSIVALTMGVWTLVCKPLYLGTYYIYSSKNCHYGFQLLNTDKDGCPVLILTPLNLTSTSSWTLRLFYLVRLGLSRVSCVICCSKWNVLVQKGTHPMRYRNKITRKLICIS